MERKPALPPGVDPAAAADTADLVLEGLRRLGHGDPRQVLVDLLARAWQRGLEAREHTPVMFYEWQQHELRPARTEPPAAPDGAFGGPRSKRRR